MTEPLTAAVIVSLFFSEAIKESGKSLVKGVTDTFTILVNTIREKFKAEGIEGLLTHAENQPTPINKAKLKDELQSLIDTDEDFANKLKQLVQQLSYQDKRIIQEVVSKIKLSEDLIAQDISQKAPRDGSVNQKMLTDIEAKNINICNLSQEA